MRLMVPVTSSASVSDIVLPIGHWLAVAAWTAAVVWRHPADRRAILYRCFGVGFALHALILVALFVPRLDDRAAFSAAVYLVYARMFCVTALALSTAWLLGWFQRLRTDRRVMVTLEAPLVIGWITLLVAVVRHNLLMALAGLAAGAIVVGFGMTQTASGSAPPPGFERSSPTNEPFLVAVFIVALGMRLLYVQPDHERRELP